MAKALDPVSRLVVFHGKRIVDMFAAPGASPPLQRCSSSASLLLLLVSAKLAVPSPPPQQTKKGIPGPGGSNSRLLEAVGVR